MLFLIIEKRNKHSPIHPNWGRLANVYGVYIQVAGKRSETQNETNKLK